jgi:3-hydroxyacyl-CoA dehydrogenase
VSSLVLAAYCVHVSFSYFLGVSPQVLDALEARVVASSRGFNAPINIAKAVRASVESPSFQDGLNKERDLFGELSKGTQAAALQYLFFSERQVSSPPKVADPTKVPNISKVGVIGGGTMGAGIAMCFAEAAIPTTLVETSTEAAQTARERIERTYKSSSAYKSGKMTDVKVDQLLSLITFTDNMHSLSSADLVVEAVFENMEVKKEIFRKLESICQPNAILATNTSYLDIDEIGSVTSRPELVIGTRKSRRSHTLPQLSLYLSLSLRLLLAGQCDEAVGGR